VEFDMPSSRSRRNRLPQFKDRLVLGDQGLRVSPFCLGWVRSAKTVVAAFEAGINFFFITTDLHWPGYEATRRGVRELLARGPEVRDQIVVAAACYQTRPILCYGPFQELLDEMPGLGRLDVLIAGAVYGDEYDRRVALYQEHRDTGYLGARAIGMSFHDRSAALAAIRDRRVDIAFIRYNPGHPGAARDLFPHLHSFPPHPQPLSPQGRGENSCPPRPSGGEGPGVRGNGRGRAASRTLLFSFTSTFGYVPPAEMEEMGLHGSVYWHPEITDHYRFALSRPEIDGVLMAPKTPEELQGVAEALARGPLTEEAQAYLMDIALVARGKAKVVPEEQVFA
jgi:aryl-alcohol dehydrogenase-like predicted oxidoreductase